MKQPLVVIVGPTAVGKTKTSIELAKRLNGEIISGDSMQIYRGMDIGTAKITKEEMQGIKHHLIDIKNPDESFSVAEFQMLVKEVIENIASLGKLPILVGGTGLYVQSVIYDYEFNDADKDEDYRKKLEQLAKKNGEMYLYDRLEKVDKEAAKHIHPHNVRRVIRALEVYHTTSIPFSRWQRQKKESPYNLTLIGLEMERALLYERINERVDEMVEKGLIEEVRKLHALGFRNCQALQAIGYKEIYRALDGEITLDEAIELLKRNSRRYAKRQFTWFKNKMDVTWFDMTYQPFDQIFTEILQYVAGKQSSFKKY